MWIINFYLAKRNWSELSEEIIANVIHSSKFRVISASEIKSPKRYLSPLRDKVKSSIDTKFLVRETKSLLMAP